MRMLENVRKRLGDAVRKGWKKTDENPWLKSIRTLTWTLPFLLGAWHAAIRPGLIRGKIDPSVIAFADHFLADWKMIVPAAFAALFVFVVWNTINRHKDALKYVLDQQHFTMTGSGRLMVDSAPYIAISAEAVKSLCAGISAFGLLAVRRGWAERLEGGLNLMAEHRSS